jgi:hypothetical protein
LESRAATDQVAPPSVEREYHTFHLPVRVSAHQTRKSPGHPVAAAGIKLFAPGGDSGIGSVQVEPPSADVVTNRVCGPRSVSFAAYAKTRSPFASPVSVGVGP